MWALRGAREEAGSWSFWCRFCTWQVTRAASDAGADALDKAAAVQRGAGGTATAVPWSHGAHLYGRDEDLLDNLERYLLAAWSADGAGVVIATSAHRRQLHERLGRRRLAGVFGDGRLVELDTDATLRLFMRDGAPDRQLFHDSIGSLVRDLAPERGPLHAFGEMVDVLWAEGNTGGALSLERLWSELQEDVHFSLLCGYAHAGVDADGRAAIAGAHDHLEIRPVSWGC